MKSNNVCKIPPSIAAKDLSLSCFVLETDKETMQKKTTLSYNRMILIECGEGELMIGGSSYAFSAGTLLFGFEGEDFKLLRGEGVRYIYIDFGGARAKDLCYRFGIYPHTRKRESFNPLIPFCKDCLLSARQENIDVVSESVLLYVLSRLSADSIPQNDTIQKIIEFTEEHFQNTELSISVIADEIGYNSKYLSHLFKEKMGVSYSEYLRSFRFKYAISLFELGISSVKNAALLSGFSDPLYFSNAFKKAIGMSPKEFISSISSQENE